MSKDYYNILGIDKSATPEEIKKAFHKAAHKYHPDKNGGDDSKFKEVNEAYQILSDKSKRAQYDQFGSTGNMGGFGSGYSGGFDPNGFGFDFSQGFGGGQGFDMNDFGDIFGDFFGGGRNTTRRPTKGRDYETMIQITLKEAMFGVKKKLQIDHLVKCDFCEGTGDKEKKQRKECKTCSGRGFTQGIKQTFIGNIQTTISCSSCRGQGSLPENPCNICKGEGILSKKEEIEVDIPSGVDAGMTLEIPGAGDAIFSGKSGSLYVGISVAKDSRFNRQGKDIFTTIDVSLADALLGATYKLETYDGEIQLKIPEGIQYGEKLRIKDKGIPTGKYSRGDLYVTVQIQIPKKINKKQKELIESFKKEM